MATAKKKVVYVEPEGYLPKEIRDKYFGTTTAKKKTVKPTAKKKSK